MSSHAVIKNGAVENVIEIDNSNPLHDLLVSQGYKLIDISKDERNIGFGWTYSDEEGFSLVIPEEKVVEQTTEQEIVNE